jgi:DNA-binding transcriptional ArsR family regulator
MEICADRCIHQEKVEAAAGRMPGPELIGMISDIFKALGDPTRLKIVIALLASELCVCDISAVCNISESAVSHQLRILRNLKIVTNRREGKIIHYSLDDDHVTSLISQSLGHVSEHRT